MVPAAASKAEAAYFSYETLQLTAATLSNLTSLGLTNASLFNFPSTSAAASSSSSSVVASGSCKAFPGDSNYPGPIAWKVLDLLTGGAVIKTLPLASPCYSNWPNYNAAECTRISNSWSDPHLQ